VYGFIFPLAFFAVKIIVIVIRVIVC